MKHISKLLVLVLALVMVLSVFAGCTETKPTEPKNTEPNTQTQPQETEPEQTGLFPLKEKKTYKIYVGGSNDWQSNLKVNGWYKELVERTNVEIEFVPLGSDAASALNAAFQSGDYGHAYIGKCLSADQVIDAGDAGYLLPLEKYLTEDIMPGYTSVLAEVPGSINGMRTTDGNIYTLARINATTMNANVESPLLINQKWMKEAGLSDVSTIAKFEQYLKYVKEHDMNGNGDPNDEIPFLVTASSSLGDAQATLQGIMNWWGIPTKDGGSEFYVVIKDGVACIAPQLPEYRVALQKVAEWYKAGYLWDQFFTGSVSTIRSLVYDSEIPVVGAINSNAYEPFDDAKYGDTTPNNGKNDNGYYAFVGIPVPEGYTPRMFVNPGILGYRDSYAVTNKCTDEDAKIILAWMDMAMFTIEGSEAACGGYWEQNKQAGFENWTNTFTKDEDGVLSRVTLTEAQLASNKAIEDSMAAGFYFYNICGSYTYCYGPSYYSSGMGSYAMRWREMDALGETYSQYWNTEIWTRPYKTPEQTTELAFLWPDVKSVITEYEVKFLTGELEFNDANWQAYMKALYKADATRLNEILQEVYDATAG